MWHHLGVRLVGLYCIIWCVWGSSVPAEHACEKIASAINQNLQSARFWGYPTLTFHRRANRISGTSCWRITSSGSTFRSDRAAGEERAVPHPQLRHQGGEAGGASSAKETAAALPASMAVAAGAEAGWGAGVADGMPSVTLKLALDRNGAVDDMSEGPKRFTSPASLDAVHRLRRDCGAVLVGVQTVVRDDPSLTVRRVPLNARQAQPMRAVLDRTLRVPGAKSCTILKDGHASVVFHSSECEEATKKAARLKAEIDASAETGVPPSPLQVDFVGLSPRSPGGGVPLTGALEVLFQRGVRHVLVEGGPTTARGFLSEGLVDRAVIIRAPVEFARPVPSNIDGDTLHRAGLELVGRTKWGADVAECWSRPELPWPRGEIENWP